MIDLPAILEEVEVLYPAFQKWVKKREGYMAYPNESDIRLWYKFLKFVEGVSDDCQRPDNSIQNK